MFRYSSVRRLAPWFIVSLLALPVVALAVGQGKENSSSSGGLVWSAAKNEQDLAKPEDAAAPAAIVGGDDGIDGGFLSLEGMLQWAIGHSDPVKLKEAAQDVKYLSPEELQRRQGDLKELMERMKMPSDAQLMQIAIDDLNNLSLSLEDRHRVLEELLILVEPIDNANDLGKLGGLSVVIRELSHSDPNIRKTSAWVLGKASQNNRFVQKQVLELGALAKLMQMVNSSFVEEAVKALYAVSALIRNNIAAQEMFYAEAGHIVLQEIISKSSLDIRLRRKAVFLVGDLAEFQLENLEKPELPFFSDHFFLKSVVDLIVSLDLDLQEKALAAVKNLLQLRATEPLVLRDFCGLEGVLEKMKQQLEVLMAEEHQRDYATDLKNLWREVELIFQRKLGLV